MARQVPIGDRRLGYVGVNGGGAARPYNVPTTAPTAVRPFGQEALARAVERLGVPINNELTALVRTAEDKAKRESSAAGISYGLGVEPDDLQLPAGDTIGEEAFRRSAIEASAAKVEIAAREDVARLRQQFAGKPEDFKNALVERQAKVIGELSRYPELSGDAMLVYERLGAAAYLDVDEERRAFERDQARATLVQLTDQITTSAAQLARSGRYEAAMEELGHLADRMGAAGPVAAGGSGALSLVEIQQQGLQAAEAIRSNFLDGWVERTPDKLAVLQGLMTGKTGDAVVDGVLAATPPDVAGRYVKGLESELRQREIESRQMRVLRKEEMRQAREETEAALTAGLLDGTRTLDDVQAAINSRAISGEQARVLTSFASSRQRQAEPDKTLAVNLMARAYDGDLSVASDATEAAANGQITVDQMRQIVNDVQEYQRSGGIFGREDARMGEAQIKRVLEADDGLGLDPDKADKAFSALKMYRRRLREDPEADPLELATKVIDVWKQGAGRAPRPRFLVQQPGAKTPDFAASAAATLDAFGRGEIDAEEAALQAEAIELMQAEVERRAQMP